MILPSIHNLPPLERGGTIARAGFDYQDHVGISYLLKMLQASSIKRVWFEGEDDIVVLWNNNGTDIVEMVQVKSNNLSSRWSVSKILHDEILEKSLRRGRCKEEVIYRIATSYDVDEELEILKHELDSIDRNPILISELEGKISQKKLIPPNEKGQTLNDWLTNCIWEKLPDSAKSVESLNKLELEKYIYNSRGKILPFDLRDELYQKLLGLVYNASLGQPKNDLTKEEIEEWIDEQLFKNFAPKGGSEAMVVKMEAAKIDSSIINGGIQMKWQYLLETMNNEYVGQAIIQKFKSEALNLLSKEKMKLDNGEIDMNPIKFHMHCCLKIEELASKHNIDHSIARGCMYDITNRCMHRFIKVAV